MGDTDVRERVKAGKSEFQPGSTTYFRNFSKITFSHEKHRAHRNHSEHSSHDLIMQLLTAVVR